MVSNRDDAIMEYFEKHFTSIEEMLTMILVNNLIDAGTVSFKTNQIEICKEVYDVLDKYSIEIGEQTKVGNFILQFLIVTEKMQIKQIQNIYDLFKNYHCDMEPVLQFTHLNGMQRKKIIERGISYYVIGKEIHIFSLGDDYS